MHRVNGRRVVAIDAPAVVMWAAAYHDVTVDLGTGDGRFVRRLAEAHPVAAAIGVDTCQANLRKTSRAAPGNALFLVADALALPADLSGIATRVTVNFPWGSLLRGLVEGNDGLLDGLRAIGRTGAALEVTVNGEALAELGLSLETGGQRIVDALRHAGAANPAGMSAECRPTPPLSHDVGEAAGLRPGPTRCPGSRDVWVIDEH